MSRTLLSVAGFDPTGGAGILLDLRVFRSMGFSGAAVITALTAQDTRSVRRVKSLPACFVEEQWTALAADLPIAGIKTGMIGSSAVLRAIVRGLSRHPGLPRVIDPILQSSTGVPLLDPLAIPGLLRELQDKATLLTPNMEEAGRLAGTAVVSPRKMEDAARRIHAKTGIACLVKGGHLRSAPVDVLFDGRRIWKFAKRRVRRDVHGTGCFLSAAILCYLARGRSLDEACAAASEEMDEALRNSERPGRGRYILRP